MKLEPINDPTACLDTAMEVIYRRIDEMPVASREDALIDLYAKLLSWTMETADDIPPAKMNSTDLLLAVDKETLQ